MEVKILIHAGLCNQLFMVFCIMSYCIDTGYKMLVYSHHDRSLLGNRTYWDSILDALKDSLVNEFDNSLPTYEEKNFHYDEIPNFNIDFNARGYFQSYKYFEHNYENIMQALKMREKKQVVYDRNKELFKKKTIAIHFRMGDYVSIQGHHPVMKKQYYEDALAYLETRLDNIKDNYDILYFCQRGDKDIVNDYIDTINKDRQYNFVKVPDELQDWEHLLVMSMCDHFIIANSSFSWFGAYFCDAKEKIVVRPSVWFGPALNHKDTKDVCPQDWIKISCVL